MARRNLSQGDLEAIHTLLVQMDEVGDPPDFVRYLELNREFHMTIYRAAGSPAINQILEHYIDQSARFIHLYLRTTDTMVKAQTEHAEIYMACKGLGAGRAGARHPRPRPTDPGAPERERVSIVEGLRA